jgi:hypothetical protein
LADDPLARADQAQDLKPMTLAAEQGPRAEHFPADMACPFLAEVQGPVWPSIPLLPGAGQMTGICRFQRRYADPGREYQELSHCRPMICASVRATISAPVSLATASVHAPACLRCVITLL